MPASLRKIKAVPKKNSLNKVLRDRTKRTRFIFLISGILLVVVGLSLPRSQAIPQGTNITSERQSSNEVASFAQEPITIDKNFISSQEKKEKPKDPPLRIIIPALDIDLPIKTAKVVKGYWEVFPDSAGFGTGSSYPSEVGNQVIFAHAREGLFLPLKEAKAGQVVYILTNNMWFSYKIEKIKEVLPSQTEVIAPTKEEILTLYTCSGFSDSKRLIVVAKKI